MLRELVKERIMAAADEIFALFERTIASYEEELSRTREEKERYRQQLEAASKVHTVPHDQDILRPLQLQAGSATLEQEDTQPPHIKVEEEEFWIPQEEKCLLALEEAALTKLQLYVVSVKTEDGEDKPPESSQLHHSPGEENKEGELPGSSATQHMTAEADGDHCGGLQEDNLLAPLSDSDDTASHTPGDEDWDCAREPLSSGTDCEDDVRTQTDNKHSECFQDKTDIQGSATIKPEDPQPPCIKEEAEELWIAPEKVCLVGQRKADLTKLPLIVVSVKTEDDEDESSQLRHSPSEENRGAEPPSSSSLQHMTSEADGGSQADNLIAPLSDSDDVTSHSAEDEDSDDIQETLSRDTDCEGDNKHSERRTGRPRWTCSVCDKSFSFKSDFAQHRKTHAGETPYSCSVCANTFTRHSNLRAHLRTHDEKTPFTCAVCSKEFSRKVRMESHMWTHTGQKPFSCLTCGKMFITNVSLIGHQRTHTGEKPFSCSVCDRRFSQKSNMRSHMRTHTGEKPFSCSFCARTFSRHDNLMSHMRIHGRCTNTNVSLPS
ncbi:zinc finger protein 544-like [Nerophis ophidion]|uniref:zinc finger protein 544-like n=1 Tax=Nerophis ophidion TaxID=159077 RepID=UPI002ADF9890|nr:zinc finger protein 544-like [Nerophis ophidion]